MRLRGIAIENIKNIEKGWGFFTTVGTEAAFAHVSDLSCRSR